MKSFGKNLFQQLTRYNNHQNFKFNFKIFFDVFNNC